jgi:hypothetical protein
MLDGAPSGRGKTVLGQLKRFFFEGVDPATGTQRLSNVIDVETQALLHLCTTTRERIDDRKDSSKPRRSYPPFCPAQADLFVDDIQRLLFHVEYIPRSVMVEYLKILFAFHLALYHLRLIKALPAMLKRGSLRHDCRLDLAPASADDSGPHCEYTIGLFVDAAGVSGTPAARLAGRSAQVWQQRIPGYVRAGYEVKKLDEFAEHLARKGMLSPPSEKIFPIDTALSLRGKKYARERETFFGQRLARVLESATDAEGELPVEVAQIMDLKMDDYTSYIEILTYFKGDFHRRYLNDCLDSLMLKNRPGALITQPSGSPRRFVLDSRLIEVLLQIALLRPGGALGFHTEPLRVDEFLTVLRRRYGIYVDRLPEGESFPPPSIEDNAALRENVAAFTDRLREIGFYSDLSDAYLTQTITPRYVITESDR